MDIINYYGITKDEYDLAIFDPMQMINMNILDKFHIIQLIKLYKSVPDATMYFIPDQRILSLDVCDGNTYILKLVQVRTFQLIDIVPYRNTSINEYPTFINAHFSIFRN